ncbi:MAG: ABC transporter permease, partial [Planktomarina sp.]
MQLSPLNQRRWQNFRNNGRAYVSLWIFAILFGLSLFAEFLANDKPIVVNYRGDLYMPIFNFYPETAFGGDFRTEAVYRDPEVKCLIRTGGVIDCLDDPDGIIAQLEETGAVADPDFDKGWMIWPPIPYSFDTPNDLDKAAPSSPDNKHWLGTDDTSRDVLARVIYGFRLSVMFALITTFFASVIGIVAGAVQGYFGGWVDLFFQRFLEIFGATPSLYVIIILTAILGRSFWLLVVISIIFGWPALTGLVRAEFFRARNFEYVRAAQALGVSNWTVMMRHILPNAMVATLSVLPFIVTGA